MLFPACICFQMHCSRDLNAQMEGRDRRSLVTALVLSMPAIVFFRLECCLGFNHLHAAPLPLPSVPALSPELCRSFTLLESRAGGWRGVCKLQLLCCHATWLENAGKSVNRWEKRGERDGVWNKEQERVGTLLNLCSIYLFWARIVARLPCQSRRFRLVADRPGWHGVRLFC